MQKALETPLETPEIRSRPRWQRPLFPTALQEKTDSSAAGDNGVREEGTRIVTDSAGREVEIPSEITKIAPSGPLAQIVLYTVSPDKLAGLAADFSDEAKQYIDEKHWGLPKFGQFYGKNASLNMEALIAEAPDVIIDIGETVKEDMDALQEQLNIPVIFVEATLPTMADAYEMLGDITGEKEQAGKLADYCRAEIAKADKNAAAIDDSDKKSVYFGLGDDGLHTNAKGSIHADVIERIGAVNAADVEAVSSGGGSEANHFDAFARRPETLRHAYIRFHVAGAGCRKEWQNFQDSDCALQLYEQPALCKPYDWNRMAGKSCLPGSLFIEYPGRGEEFLSAFLSYRCN